MNDEFGGIALEDEPARDEFGGVAVSSAAPLMRPSAASLEPQPDWDKFGGLLTPHVPTITSLRDMPIRPGTSTTQGGPKARLASLAETLQEPVEAVGETLTHPSPIPTPFEVKKEDSVPVAIGKEVVNLGVGIPQFFTSALGIESAAAATVAPTVVAGAFTADMLYNLGKQIQNTYQNWTKMSSGQKAAAVTDMVGTGVMAGLLGKSTIKGVRGRMGLEELPQIETPEQAAQRAQTIQGMEAPRPDAAGRLQQLKTAPERTPEQQAELETLTAQNQAAQKTAADVFRKSMDTGAGKGTAPPEEVPLETKEVTQIAPSGMTAEDFELRPKLTEPYRSVAMLQGGKVIEGKPGDNHASIAERLGFPKDLIPGFIDKRGNFVYQYAEDVPKPTPPPAGIKPAATEGMSVGPGAASPGDIARGTALKNITGALERHQMGLPEARKTIPRPIQLVAQEAADTLTKDPQAGQKIANALKWNPERGLTDTEAALLLSHKESLINQRNQAASDTITAKTPEAKAEAEARFAGLNDQLVDILDAAKFRGSQWGREGIWRQVLKDEDFSLERMVSDKQAALGRKLDANSPPDAAILKQLADQSKRIAELEAQLKERQSTQQQSQRGNALDEGIEEAKQTVATERKSRSSPDPAKVEETIKTQMERRASDEDFSLDSISNLINRLALNFVRKGITERMPLVDAVHGVLREFFPELTKEQTMDAISGFGRSSKLDPEPAKATLRDLKGQMQQLGKMLKVAREEPIPKTGVERRVPSAVERQLIKMVNRFKKVLGVVVTDPAAQLKSALDGIKTRMRNEIEEIEYALASKTPRVNNKGEVEYDAEAKALKEQLDRKRQDYGEMFPKSPMTDAERIAKAGQILDRQIEEVERQIKTGEIFPPGKRASSVPFDAGLEAKKAQLEALKAEREYARQTVQPSPEPADVAIQRRASNLDRQIENIEKQIKNEEVFPKGRKVAEAETPENQARIDRLKALKEERQWIRDRLQPKPGLAEVEAQRRSAQLDRQIEKLNKEISEGRVFPEHKAASEKPTNERIAAKEAEVAALKEQKRWIADSLQPKPSPEESALLAWKVRALNKIAELQDKRARGDFEKPVRQQKFERDRRAEEIQIQLEGEKKKYQEGLRADQFKKLGKWDKALYWFLKFRRGIGVLSSPVSFVKLFGAAVLRLGTIPVEEGIGTAMRLVPDWAKVMKSAPIEGGGLSMELASSYVKSSRHILKDAWQTLKTGKSELDVAWGKAHGLPPEAIEIFGRLHGVMKSPVKRYAFEFALQRQVMWNLKHGIDVTDPMVSMQMHVRAYEWANRQIFLNNTAAVRGWRAAIRTVESKGGAGKALSTAMQYELPIVNVPTSIISEAMTYAMGLPVGAVKARLAVKRGIENLKPEQADQIARSLKKGALGAALFTLGWYGYESIGGFYQPGLKKNPDDPHFNDIEINGVPISHNLIHAPSALMLQMASTFRRESEASEKKGGEPQGPLIGSAAAIWGLGEETPFLRETMELSKFGGNRWERRHAIGSQMRDAISPLGLQWVAKASDVRQGNILTGEPIRRKPTNLTEEIKLGIPGLRQQVPEARKK